MSQLEKLLLRIINNPKTVRFEELDKLLQRAEFERFQPKGGSSHYIYRKDDYHMTIPRKTPYIKEIYVKRAIEAIGDYFSKEMDEDAD
ncbi:hypothetical protein SOV_12010 [Sporomusa ovata DSM 2662]|uniref:HicA protein n=1 Tax=Sporomusa ovata TaxID=2378 RepID=A0A0U1KXT3_9FIRM|nr:hypothetical protein [Sporomusa ovata]EQB28813.1 hypothetical protein SOV_1c05390 [Sporomusa ovata DSM 2662]CQR72238.1 hypothetical protein SpAn4DRAFT_2698 [Sporomusa ovata]